MLSLSAREPQRPLANEMIYVLYSMGCACLAVQILSFFQTSYLRMHRFCPIHTIHRLYKHVNIVTTRKLCCRKDISGSNEPLQRYRHSKLSKMATCRELGFDVTGNSAIRSADPENPTIEPNMKCIG